MEEKNQDQNQNEVLDASVETEHQPTGALKNIVQFEMQSWFAMMLVFGAYTCAAMSILANLAAK